MATKNRNTPDYSFPNASTFNIAIVVSRWNAEITDNLLDGAVKTLKKHGVSKQQITVEYVTGSFELIFGAKLLHDAFSFDAIITIGSVIRGETAHFDYVCQAVSNGIANLNIEYEYPTIFCVLTDDTMQQSIDRSGGKYGNKGSEAALAALEMAELAEKFSMKGRGEEDFI